MLCGPDWQNSKHPLSSNPYYMQWPRWWVLTPTCYINVSVGGRAFCAEGELLVSTNDRELAGLAPHHVTTDNQQWSCDWLIFFAPSRCKYMVKGMPRQCILNLDNFLQNLLKFKPLLALSMRPDSNFSWKIGARWKFVGWTAVTFQVLRQPQVSPVRTQ